VTIRGRGRNNPSLAFSCAGPAFTTFTELEAGADLLLGKLLVTSWRVGLLTSRCTLADNEVKGGPLVRNG
jgi:hypothetical protein